MEISDLEQGKLQQLWKRLRDTRDAEELASSQPSVSLNIGAANRFISQAVPELSQEQRRKLREVGEEVVA